MFSGLRIITVYQWIDSIKNGWMMNNFFIRFPAFFRSKYTVDLGRLHELKPSNRFT
jgi:hypothetical protein